jgi:hypothetical protein
VSQRRGNVDLGDQLKQLGRECAALPDQDSSHTDQIIGFDDHGMW